MTITYDENGPPIERLITIMERLRDPQTGCPWDVQQTFETIAPYTVEEAYEVSDAIVRGDMDDLKSELGDLLLQVVYHSQIAREQNQFDFDQVTEAICEKMVRRHPHVFGDASILSDAQLKRNWESAKQKERYEKGESDSSQLAGVAVNLPPWMRALKLQKRAAHVHFDWPDQKGVFDKLQEELSELQEALEGQATQGRVKEEFGDVLFTVLNLARHLRVQPEQCLSISNKKFEQRFRGMEDIAMREGRELNSLSSEDWEQLWNQAKELEK